MTETPDLQPLDPGCCLGCRVLAAFGDLIQAEAAE